MRCALWRRLPPALAQDARQTSASGCVDSAVQCQLPRHEAGPHYGLLEDTRPTAALWLRWQGTDVELTVLPDCPAVAPGLDGDGCCLFAGHPHQHTWEEALPEEDALRIS